MDDENKDESVTPALSRRLRAAIAAGSGWIGFDRFMHMALYEPGLGYYSNAQPKIGRMPAGKARARASEGPDSDFVTAPEMSALFGQCLARQIAEALHVSGTDTVYEFGAGNGTLARDILTAIGPHIRRYCIVDVSASLRARQAQALQAFGAQVQWLEALPDTLEGVLLGNEVLDAMPVKLLARHDGQWQERGVAWETDATEASDTADAGSFIWQDRPGKLRPPIDIPNDGDYLTELHPQAEAFVRTTSERLARGAALWIDYGFGEREYYHPERSMGTLVCHHRHQVDSDPLALVGQKDITSHVNFTGVAVAAQETGLEVLGYTSQGRFLINCGIEDLLQAASLPQRSMAAKLLHEHEMGELFKVMMLGRGPFWEPLGFTRGDRTHTL
ncbi:class I SAM-dependent methyltransferase [Corticibacter populi]|uniref:Class I SAM-dependent methyltransferase n=1 Tax=Corticibacter populi TaxID=1550736 RepID=A0A3M6QRQ7_9BURK|nr:SAM-dependent methyltransferase [Corticibacter populi]RMX05726.1 class I SAM-dependent methyltransferase [Corticibacter populi]